MKKVDVAIQETRERAVELVVDKAEHYRENQSITNDSDILFMKDEMAHYWLLIEKIQRARTDKQIYKLLANDYLIANHYSKKDLKDIILS